MTAEGLKEGEVYETKGKAYRDPAHGNLCYYIEGLGQKLACRFTELLEDNFISKKELESIKMN